MKFISLLIILCLLVSSCNSAPPWVSLARKARYEFAYRMKKEENLIMYAEGGAMMHNIKMLSLDFDSSRALDLEESRILILRVTQSFVDFINANTAIRPYLANYPFSVNNVEIGFSFRSYGERIYKDGKMSLVYFKQGTIFYDRYNPETKRLETVLRETYEEALQRAS